ncbi:MAG: glycosyltransferase [Alphaproteobacteria bacterium]
MGDYDIQRVTVDAVMPSFSVGGSERVMLSLLSGLDKCKFDIRLLVLNPTGPMQQAAVGIENVQLVGSPRLSSALPKLMKLVSSRKPDILFGSQAHVNLALSVLSWFVPKSSLVLREANMPSLCLREGHWPFWYKWAYRLLLPRADHVIATSGIMASEFINDFAVPESRVTILPNPVDVDTIREKAIPADRRDGAGRRFIAVGRLERQKGFDRLIDWMATTDSNDHLTIVGEGSQRPLLERKLSQCDYRDRISLAGMKQNPWSCVAGADAFLMSSRWEGLPNAVLEALAVGTPVIVTRESGGIHDIADAAPVGAVTIADTEADFVAAMKNVKPCTVPELRPTLLPEIYYGKNVSAAFEMLLLKLRKSG